MNTSVVNGFLWMGLAESLKSLLFYFSVHVFPFAWQPMQLVTELFSITTVITVQALPTFILELFLEYSVFTSHSLIALILQITSRPSNLMASTVLVFEVRLAVLMTIQYAVYESVFFNVYISYHLLWLCEVTLGSLFALSDQYHYSDCTVYSLSFQKTWIFSSLKLQMHMKNRFQILVDFGKFWPCYFRNLFQIWKEHTTTFENKQIEAKNSNAHLRYWTFKRQCSIWQWSTWKLLYREHLPSDWEEADLRPIIASTSFNMLITASPHPLLKWFEMSLIQQKGDWRRPSYIASHTKHQYHSCSAYSKSSWFIFICSWATLDQAEISLSIHTIRRENTYCNTLRAIVRDSWVEYCHRLYSALFSSKLNNFLWYSSSL